MLGYTMGLDDNVVDVELDIYFGLVFEDPIHQSLVCSACVL